MEYAKRASGCRPAETCRDITQVSTAKQSNFYYEEVLGGIQVLEDVGS